MSVFGRTFGKVYGDVFGSAEDSPPPVPNFAGLAGDTMARLLIG